MILCRVVLSMLSREMQRSAPLSKARRRSEIDRRLDSLVPAGRLKDSHTTTIVKVQLPCSRAQDFSLHVLQALCHEYRALQHEKSRCNDCVFRTANRCCGCSTCATSARRGSRRSGPATGGTAARGAGPPAGTRSPAPLADPWGGPRPRAAAPPGVRQRQPAGVLVHHTRLCSQVVIAVAAYVFRRIAFAGDGSQVMQAHLLLAVLHL